MPRGVHHVDRKIAKRQRVAFFHQLVKSGAIMRNIISFKHCAKYRLNLRNLRPYDDGRASHFAQMMRRRKMIGMGVGFKQIEDIKPLSGCSRKQRVGRSRPDPPVTRTEIEHRVNDCRLFRGGIMDDVTHRIGSVIEESLNRWNHEYSPYRHTLALANLE